MDLDNERESILRQQVTPTQKAHMFINRAHELQLGRSQWQVLVWPLPIDIIDAIGRVWQQKGTFPLRGQLVTTSYLCTAPGVFSVGVLWLSHFQLSSCAYMQLFLGAERECACHAVPDR